MKSVLCAKTLMMRTTIVLPTIAFLLASRCLFAQDADWKLKPLEYNNPGLSVDLGVGLWSWPMPMDYDGDGDMDLLVSCPDKPSNGVYFFENPHQDPVRPPTTRPEILSFNRARRQSIWAWPCPLIR